MATVIPCKSKDGHQLKDKEGKLIWRIKASGGFDGAGKRIQPTGTVHGARKDAQNAADRLQAQTDRAGSEHIRTVAEWVEEYLRLRKGHVSARTLDGYRRMAELRVIPQLGKQPLPDVLPKHIHLFLDKIGSKRLDGRGERLSSNTVGKYYRFLHLIFAEAFYRGFVEGNPVIGVKPPEVARVRPTYLKSEEIQIVLKALKAEPLSLRVAFMLALTTGMRRGEIIALHWSDIDMDAQVIRVEHAVTTSEGKQLIGCTKTARSVRTVSATADLLSVLAEWRQQCPQTADNLVFTWPDGKWWHIDFVSKAWREFCTRAKVSPINFHGLRHTNASLLLSAGLGVAEVAEHLGHASPSTTMNIYTHTMKKSSTETRKIMTDVLMVKNGV